MALANMLQDAGVVSAISTSGEGDSFKASFSLLTAMFTSDFWAKQKDDELHATGGQVGGAANLADKMRGQAIDKLLAGDATGAQELLGGGAHPVQDKTAHEGISFAKHMVLTVIHKAIRILTLGLVNPHLDPDDPTKQGGEPYKQATTDTKAYFDKFETEFSEKARSQGYSEGQIQEKLRAVKGSPSGTE
jgi:hypothetical protein